MLIDLVMIPPTERVGTKFRSLKCLPISGKRYVNFIRRVVSARIHWSTRGFVCAIHPPLFINSFLKHKCDHKRRGVVIRLVCVECITSVLLTTVTRSAPRYCAVVVCFRIATDNPARETRAPTTATGVCLFVVGSFFVRHSAASAIVRAKDTRYTTRGTKSPFRTGQLRCQIRWKTRRTRIRPKKSINKPRIK